jgi:hypothetical protein
LIIIGTVVVVLLLVLVFGGSGMGTAGMMHWWRERKCVVEVRQGYTETGVPPRPQVSPMQEGAKLNKRVDVSLKRKGLTMRAPIAIPDR